MASLLFISLLIHVSHAFFIPIINVRFEGETDVFVTGILEYTILTGAANLTTETLNIICTNIAYGNNTSVVLERKGENPQVQTKSLGIIRATLDQNCTAESSCEGNYTCSVNISQQIAHGVAYTYTMKRTFQIRQASVIACKSRVGTTVILQEGLNFLCFGKNIFWNRNNMTTTFFRISQTNTDVSCGKYANNTWVETCATEIIVKPLEIEILPKNFTSSTPLLQFNCSSYPPRLMYWAVYSTNGNILDAGNQNQSILVNTTISIDQSIGFTSISITEDIPGGNDIQEVICLTYDTQMAVAIAHLVTDDSPPVTDNFHQSTSTTDTMTIPEQSRTTVSASIPYIVTDNFHQSTTTDHLTIPEQSRTTVAASIPYIVVIIVLSLIIAIGATFELYKIFKSRNASSKSAGVEKNVTPAETEMQDNIIYQSAEKL